MNCQPSVQLGFVLDPPLDDDLRERIIAVWVAATNAGGAVGFVAPVTAAQVRPTAEAAFAGVAAGIDRLLVGVDAAGWPRSSSSPATGSTSRSTGACSNGWSWHRTGRAVATGWPCWPRRSGSAARSA